jgi:nicotinamide-nucleotide amidase
MNSPRVEIINTGSELLLGRVRDSHLSWLGRKLFEVGLRVTRQTTVPDGGVIRDALLEAFSRAEIVIVTGGLGPTTDDITREVVAELLGLRLKLHQETLNRIHERCRKRGFAFQDRMSRQAMVPEGAIVIPNDYGTAPGLHIAPTEGVSWITPHLFLLPGPPRELQPMASAYVIPYLSGLVSGKEYNECRIYKVVGMGESLLEAAVGLELSKRGDIEVGYCARPNEVDFRLIGPRAILEEVEPFVLAGVGDHLVSDDSGSMEEVLVNYLREAGVTLATAESCTGGAIADSITDVAGSSDVFLGGYVAYSNECKSRMLGLDPELIRKHGAVSAEVVEGMARGALDKTGASHALAVTGIAGPGGGTPEKPVGTVWLALASMCDDKTIVWKENFPTDRITFKQMVVQSALDRLRKRLKGSAR